MIRNNPLNGFPQIRTGGGVLLLGLDESGLGKTIKAGLIMRELKLRARNSLPYFC